eukprot:11218883-Alexandrium_andersonii.AAC.1
MHPYTHTDTPTDTPTDTTAMAWLCTKESVHVHVCARMRLLLWLCLGGLADCVLACRSVGRTARSPV